MKHPLTTTKREMLALEHFYPHHWRELAEQILFSLSILFLSLSVLLNVMIDSPLGQLWPISEGLFLVCFALLLKTILIELYFHSLRIRLEEEEEMSLATFLVIALHHPKKKDLAKAFLHSRMGKEVMVRLGIAKESIAHFLEGKKDFELALPTKGFFGDLAGYLHDSDHHFRDFMDSVHVSKDLFTQSSKWTEEKHRHHLSGRPFLRKTFHEPTKEVLSIERVARTEIEELERFYRIIITEQATMLIIAFFKEDLLLYITEDARGTLLVDLIETCLADHREHFHGASIIMPSDVRNFLIRKKAVS